MQQLIICFVNCSWCLNEFSFLNKRNKKYHDLPTCGVTRIFGRKGFEQLFHDGAHYAQWLSQEFAKRRGQTAFKTRKTEV